MRHAVLGNAEYILWEESWVKVRTSTCMAVRAHVLQEATKCRGRGCNTDTVNLVDIYSIPRRWELTKELGI